MSQGPRINVGSGRARTWVTILGAMLVAAVIGFVVDDRVFATDVESEAEHLVGRQTTTSAALVSSTFDRFADPLLLIADTPDIHSLVNAALAGGIDPATGTTFQELRAENNEVFAAAMAHGRFDKLRFIDAEGIEQVKLVLGEDGPVPTSIGEMRDESHEDYFQIPRDEFSRGDVYSSQPKIGSSEDPVTAAAHASLRISVGVFDDAGRFHGIIVANVTTATVFSALDGANDWPTTGDSRSLGSVTYVIDDRGQYLFAPEGTELFGLETGRGHTVVEDWGAEVAARIATEGIASANDHVLLAAPFNFGPVSRWTVLTTVEESAFGAPAHSPYLGAALMGALVLIIATVFLLQRQLRVTAQQQAIADELRVLDAAKTEFVALASHELRTPLTGIYGFASLLADSGDLTESSQTWADHVRDEAARLTQIINDLLNLSTIESQDVVLDHEPIDLVDVIAVVTTRFSGSSDDHPLTVTGPDRRGVAVVSGDDSRLTEVVSNLVDNAIKYSPSGGAVTVACTVDETVARVSVTDQGIGIATEDLARLFGKFQRISRPETESIRSTGLGLYMVKLLVTRMGGTITVESTNGVGSTFTVQLPLATSTPLAA